MPIHIPGPAGELEAVLTESSNHAGRSAVLCHPHPQYGGSMHDAVLDTAERALLATGTHCLRFNFRGVGASAGSHDGGVGEVDDVAAVVTWLRAERPGDELILGGYSFGAAMAWHALDRIEEPARVLLIAPPVGMMDLPSRSLGAPVDVVTGDQDQFVDADVLAGWQGVAVHTIEGADHFFAGQWPALHHLLLELLTVG